MTPERWQQIKSVFHAALEREPRERASFLDEACAGDEEARREVSSLISAHEQTGEFLDDPAYRAVSLSLTDETRESVAEGRLVAHYRILAPLGAGGMGEVYLAEDMKLGRKVALKILPAAFTRDEERVRRFRQEARAASALSHPNVSVIHEIGEAEEGLHFIAMEYVEGETLRARMKGRGITLDEALDFAAQSASALAAAHAAGVVHRDIKPENVMVRTDGLVKVLDFGIAKLAEQTASAANPEALTRALVETGTGILMGTARYMSPEQARGLPVDARTDVWSLGCVLYEMLAGRAAFAAETHGDTIVAVLEREPPALSHFAANVPAELERIVRKSLRKPRAERYQTARDMELDLKALRRELEIGAEVERSMPPLSSEESRASARTGAPMRATGAQSLLRTTSPDEKHSQPAANRKRRVLTVAAFASLALAFVAVAYLWWSERPPQQGPSQTLATKVFERTNIIKVTTNGNARAAAVSPDGKYVAYVMTEGERHSLWVRQVATAANMRIVPNLIFFTLSFSPDGNYIFYLGPDAEDTATLYRIPAFGLGAVPVKVVSNIQSEIGFSPDGERIAFLRNDLAKKEGEIIIARADGTGEQTLAVRKLPAAMLWNGGPVWSPDGKRLACPVVVNEEGGSYNSVVEVRLDDFSERLISNERWDQVTRVAWLPDGSGLLMVARERNGTFFQLWLLSYPDGKVRRLTSDLSEYGDVGITADARTIVSVQGQTLGNIWHAPKGEAARAAQVTSGAGRYYDLAWDADGRIIYASDATGSADIWEMNADGSGQRQLTVGAGKNYAPTLTPDGRFIVFHSNRSGGWQLWRMDRDGGNPKQLTDGSGDSNFPQVAPDGRTVIFHYRGDRLTNIRKVSIDGGPVVELTDKLSMRASISPDGKLIACWYNDENSAGGRWHVGIVSLEKGGIVELFEVPNGSVNWDSPLRWTPDGRAITYRQERNGVENLWAQPLAGGPAKKLTDFKSERIFDFLWSRTGDLLLSRGVQTNDVVLITDVGNAR